MKVLMLGWEYPPHISGGLGTACQGLTQALSEQGVQITFVVPRLYGGESSTHMRLVGLHPTGSAKASDAVHLADARQTQMLTIAIPAALKPYLSPNSYLEVVSELRAHTQNQADLNNPPVAQPYGLTNTNRINPYAGDLFAEVIRYSENVLQVVAHESFDLVHAHDWMTFQAGIVAARALRVPLIVHVHSLEYDRSGHNVNPHIHAIEHAGLWQADRVIAVSSYTRRIIREQHEIPLDKVVVVHNGLTFSSEPDGTAERAGRLDKSTTEKTVLFLGRITFQKGPDYFVEAATRVLRYMPEVTFVMAGSGDMLPQVQRRVRELGLEARFEFPGFLQGSDVARMFRKADLYVMPSVSEPFGISPLEAMVHGTPVIISKQSGVAEVLRHALKVDFWDVEELANLMLAALKYPELRSDMVAMGQNEVRRIQWSDAAAKVIQIYRDLLSGR